MELHLYNTHTPYHSKPNQTRPNHIKGQTKLNFSKQKQIEHFINTHHIDIVNLQEINMDDESFYECDNLMNNYTVIENNAINKYGTACLINNNIATLNHKKDTNGRIISFDVGEATFCNIYIQAGSEREMRANRENQISEDLPNILFNCKPSGLVMGDWNCITKDEDATNNPASKKSPSLKRLITAFDWKDGHKIIHPTSKDFSHYYEEGATRIDRGYLFGGIKIINSEYFGIAFSDHFAYVTTIQMPENCFKSIMPKFPPLFKAKPEVVTDNIFKARLDDMMKIWNDVKDSSNIPLLIWWEEIIKPGIKKLLQERGKEIRQERNGILNILLLKQTYLVKRIQQINRTVGSERNGRSEVLAELREAQMEIENWYLKESERVIIQAKIHEIDSNEKVRIYHHENHRRHIRKSAINKLDTEQGILEGHDKCKTYLENKIEALLGIAPVLDFEKQNVLLDEVTGVFNKEDNDMLEKTPTKKEVKSQVWSSNSMVVQVRMDLQVTSTKNAGFFWVIP